MSCPIQFSYNLFRYVTDERERYINLFILDLHKGNIDKYLLSMVKFFTYQWRSLYNMSLDFNDLSFYIRARFYRCTVSDRYKRLDYFYSDYSLEYLNTLLDNLDYKRLHLILVKNFYYGKYYNRSIKERYF